MVKQQPSSAKSRLLTFIALLFCLAVVLEIVFLLPSPKEGRYQAESFVTSRPLNPAILRSDFQRKAIKSCPGVVRLTVVVEPLTSTTLKGTTRETNGLIRLLAAGPDPAAAERAAGEGATRLCDMLQQSFGSTSRIVGRTHSFASSSVHQRTWFTFREAAQLRAFPVAGRVFFDHAGVSIDPGSQWDRHYDWIGYPACYLAGLSGVGKFSGNYIQVFLADEAVSSAGAEGWTFVARRKSDAAQALPEVEAAMAESRSRFQTNSRAITSSWREEPFASDSGVRGTRLSFIEQYPVFNPRLGGTMTITKAVRQYLLTNAQRRWVMLQYFTLTGSASDADRQMIEKTLRLEP
ncbi:MAG TPA: hypothetical protein VN829_10115 [Dongiaceae bacterium]|nr:hypothetical protein [Dongiaceae bacterium]